ncbi:hypothetical protein [Caballeronia mineralivorans]|nr:hypothetical protein [Caballeronia mineralivorans]
MAYLPEVENYDVGVYQIAISDGVIGYNPTNPNTAANQGISNQAALNLANRTNWLYTNLNLVIAGTTIPPTVAPLNSAGLTGTPTTPTPPLGDNSLKISNTAWVQSLVSGVLNLSVAGGTNVSLSAVQAGNGTLNFTGALTANIAVILPNVPGKWVVENNTTGAFTLTVKTAAGTGVAVTQGKINSLFGDGTNIYPEQNDFSSIQLTGTPTTVTPPVGDNSTKIATTASCYQLKNGVVTVNVAGGANVVLTAAQYGNGIILLTGALTAAIEVIVPAQGGTYVISNQTTGAFALTLGVSGGGSTAVIPQGQSVLAYCDGTNVVLAGNNFSNVALTGTPTTPTPTALDSSTKVANTAWANAIGPVVGSVRNAAMSVTAASASATFTADEIIVETALGGAPFRLASFNKTINLAATGAGGMDTGAAPVSGFVALYAIYNPTTQTAALLATNAAALQPNVYGGANMPAGYTASALLSVWQTNASKQFVIGYQQDRAVTMSQYTALSTSTSAVTSLSLGANVPPNARSVDGVLLISNTAASSMILSIAALSGIPGRTLQMNPIAAGQTFQTSFVNVGLATAQTIFYAASSSSGTPTFGIYITAYYI